MTLPHWCWGKADLEKPRRPAGRTAAAVVDSADALNVLPDPGLRVGWNLTAGARHFGAGWGRPEIVQDIDDMDFPGKG